MVVFGGSMLSSQQLQSHDKQQQQLQQISQIKQQQQQQVQQQQQQQMLQVSLLECGKSIGKGHPLLWAE